MHQLSAWKVRMDDALPDIRQHPTHPNCMLVQGQQWTVEDVEHAILTMQRWRRELEMCSDDERFVRRKYPSYAAQTQNNLWHISTWEPFQFISGHCETRELAWKSAADRIREQEARDECAVVEFNRVAGDGADSGVHVAEADGQV